MKPNVLACAEQVVKNRHIKNIIGNILDESRDDIQDILLAFVTTDWEVDAYWTGLSRGGMQKVLSALKSGIGVDANDVCREESDENV